MKQKKRISILLIFMMLFSISLTIPSVTYAATIPYSGIPVSSGHYFPVNIVIGQDDRLYVAEYSGNKIIKMDRGGQNKTTFVSGISQPVGMVFDAAGNLYVAQYNGSKVIKVDSSGNTTLTRDFSYDYLTGIALSSEGKLFVVSYWSGKIYKMNTDGTDFSEFATGLRAGSLIGMTIDEDDNLYVADLSNNKVIKITPDATVSDFITNIALPRWVALGKDGFFYVAASGSRTIEKISQNGTKVATFSTGTFAPWGISVDAGGYIYFTESNNSTHKIVGNAETFDTRHIGLIMNTEMSDGYADPAAFLVSGAASNPQVINAVVSGSSITLTLNESVAALDNSLKVSYAKTGINNITTTGINSISTTGSVYELDDFSNLSIKNNILLVINAESIPQIKVAKGTSLNEVNLPVSGTVYLNNTTTSAAITWDGGTPAYNGNIAGTYTFSGTFNVGNNISNPNNIKASVDVVVSDAPPVIPPTENLDQPVPTGLIGVTPTSLANSDGKITGTATGMEYKLSSSGTWLPVTSTEIIGLPAGTYPMRYAAKTGFNASPSVNVIVEAYRAPSTGGSSSGSSSSPLPLLQLPSVSNDIEMIINNEIQKSGTEIRTEINGRTEVRVVVDSQQMNNHIEKAIKINNGNNEVIVPVLNTGDTIRVALTGEVIKKMEDNNFKLSVKDEKIEYRIDAENFTIEKAAQTMGVSLDNLQSIDVEVSINKITSVEIEALKEQAKASGHTIVFEPVQFEITARITSADGKVEELKINRFNSFAERIIEIPEGIDPSNITTGIVFNKDGSYSHVPTVVFEKGGKWYASINSLTNSTYAVIGNPVAVDLVKGHWSEKVINDMASRLILVDHENFVADKAVTRAEFAEYIVRASGLYREGLFIENKFTDIGTSKHLTSILIANDWGIIQGYLDGTFKPEAAITREEAMTMYAKVMDIVRLPEGSNNRILQYKDAKQVATWAYEAVSKTLSAGVFNGRTEDTITPKGTLTHAEALTAIRNLLTESGLINK
ncbi:S-layer homology domain-containing protein [Cellulosilyticum sp. I15G10I2]|uniref:S-layer homology domain-containing protein n=1 Tax=Cellulosilyticum sp. I15G10I2 TaxID=1892843 RepID=UPI00085BCA04|nr:S-layer homology domain-containing protein [Cellulosilyticum sp. I15G10I2]